VFLNNACLSNALSFGSQHNLNNKLSGTKELAYFIDCSFPSLFGSKMT
jgi:hypothetical protein